MAPYARWVHSSFKQTLIDACDEFLESNDRGTDKKRTEVIKRVSKDITDIAQE
jgi:vacuolar-type H+-ATPase subunit H